MKNTPRIIATLSCFMILYTAFSTLTVYSQGTTPTATPPTTNTPEITPTGASGINSAPLTTAYTQSDLTLLTGNIQRPNGLVWHDGKLYAACSGDWTIYEIDAKSGSTTQYIYGPKNAHAMVAKSGTSNTSLWIPDFQSNSVLEITQGVVNTLASDLGGPWGITSFGDSSFLVTNIKGNNVVLVGEGGPKEVISQLRSPTGITNDAKNIYVANTGSARRAIEWFAVEALTASTASIDAEDQSISRTLVTGLQNVTNITMGPDGLLYFGYSLGTRGVVGRVNPITCQENGGCSSDQVEIVVFTELAAPLAGLTISTDLELYIHSIFSPEIYWVDLKLPPKSS